MTVARRSAEPELCESVQLKHSSTFFFLCAPFPLLSGALWDIRKLCITFAELR